MLKVISAASSHKEGLERPSLTGKLSSTSNAVVSRSLPSSFTKEKVDYGEREEAKGHCCDTAQTVIVYYSECST